MRKPKLNIKYCLLEVVLKTGDKHFLKQRSLCWPDSNKFCSKITQNYEKTKEIRKNANVFSLLGFVLKPGTQRFSKPSCFVQAKE